MLLDIEFVSELAGLSSDDRYCFWCSQATRSGIRAVNWRSAFVCCESDECQKEVEKQLLFAISRLPTFKTAARIARRQRRNRFLLWWRYFRLQVHLNEKRKYEKMKEYPSAWAYNSHSDFL